MLDGTVSGASGAGGPTIAAPPPSQISSSRTHSHSWRSIAKEVAKGAALILGGGVLVGLVAGAAKVCLGVKETVQRWMGTDQEKIKQGRGHSARSLADADGWRCIAMTLLPAVGAIGVLASRAYDSSKAQTLLNETAGTNVVSNELAAAARSAGADTQFEVGKRYLDARNPEQARAWFQRAADQGHTEALFQLALILPVDDKRREKILNKLANAGHREAQVTLAKIYTERVDRTVPSQMDAGQKTALLLKARELLFKAIESFENNPPKDIHEKRLAGLAHHEFALILNSDENKQPEKIVDHFNKALAFLKQIPDLYRSNFDLEVLRAIPNCRTKLGEVYDRMDPQILRSMADSDNRDAKFKFAERLETGEGVDKDLDAAFTLYLSAAEDPDGLPTAKLKVAEMLAKGQGTPKDLNRALDYCIEVFNRRDPGDPIDEIKKSFKNYFRSKRSHRTSCNGSSTFFGERSPCFK